MKLRPYQAQALDACRAAFRAGNRGVFLVAPCGTGKTIMFADVCARATDRGKRALVLVHRQELLGQASRKLDLAGVAHNIIAASARDLERIGVVGAPNRPGALVDLAMIQTLTRRAAPPNDHYAIIICDEAHLSQADSYQALFARHPSAFRLLVSATPSRLDGRGFEPDATALVECPRIPWMQAQGYLVDLATYSIPGVDLQGLHTRAGEFVQEEVAERFMRTKIVGDCVREYQAHAAGRRAFAFAASVEHSQTLRDAFLAAGIPAAHVDATTPLSERNVIFERLRTGECLVLTNMGIACEGVDVPDVACIIIARATQSETLWIQMAGRGLRPATDKRECVLLDHGGNCERHGMIEAPRVYSLAGTEKRLKDAAPAAVATCQNCLACMPSSATVCPRCGSPKLTKPRAPIVVNDDTLLRVRPEDFVTGPDGRPKRIRACPRGVPDTAWQHIERIRITRGYHWGWSLHRIAEMG